MLSHDGIGVLIYACSCSCVFMIGASRGGCSGRRRHETSSKNRRCRRAVTYCEVSRRPVAVNVLGRAGCCKSRFSGWRCSALGRHCAIFPLLSSYLQHCFAHAGDGDRWFGAKKDVGDIPKEIALNFDPFKEVEGIKQVR